LSARHSAVPPVCSTGTRASPSSCWIEPQSASQIETARSSIARNTPPRSKAERLMTWSTSAVAVCCWSASFVSLNSRTFSIAIAAWSANVLTRSTSGAVNAPVFRPSPIAPIASPLLSTGMARRLIGPSCGRLGSSRASATTTISRRRIARPTTVVSSSGWRHPMTEPGTSSVVRPAKAEITISFPSRRWRVAASARARRPARSVIVSSTVSRSNADRLIDASTSLIAVWRPSALFVSLNRRTLSMAMTACAAKVSASSIWRSVNGFGSVRRRNIAPIGPAALRRGVATIARVVGEAATPSGY